MIILPCLEWIFSTTYVLRWFLIMFAFGCLFAIIRGGRV